MFPDNQLFTDKKIRIEEPFDGTNTARAVYKPESFPKIKFAIQTAQQLLERCLNGGEEIQELISELYLDKQELEVCDFDVLVFHFIQKYLDYHYAGGIGLNFTGVRFGRRSKAPRRSAEHIFILSSSDSSEDEEQGQNSSTKRPSKKKEATKNREEQTVEVAEDQGSCPATKARCEESNGHAGEVARDHKGSVSDEGVGTFTGDTLTVESDEEDNEFEIVEDASTSSVLDEKKQKNAKDFKDSKTESGGHELR